MAVRNFGLTLPVLATVLVFGAEWSQFRGPNGSGVSDSGRRHAAHELRSGCGFVPARGRQEERPCSVAHGAASRAARICDACHLPTAEWKTAGTGGRLLSAVRLRSPDRQGSLVDS